MRTPATYSGTHFLPHCHCMRAPAEGVAHTEGRQVLDGSSEKFHIRFAGGCHGDELDKLPEFITNGLQDKL
jgi:hypothetical protein